ncbi:N-acetylglucosamine-6-phosphate deacetylase [Paenibacillus silvisoli]|uniref:N-acetylglucosamine-6-phosphate deacetylase n=1 Tax=Paenibacillus silvisoli TaxID=3110539 RepID=UPI002805376F|nr:N-acetylglucosamine-6-phosphate deacetylase [Paenibacillus silvisoli]
MSLHSVCWRNAAIYTPEGIVSQGTLVVDGNGRIAAIGGPELAIAPDLQVVDASGLLLLPGMIDVHIHGGNGCGVMAGEYEQLDGISRFHAAHGTTAFLATTTTAPLEQIKRALNEAAHAIQRGVSGAALVGIHLEGPYINEKRRGAQSKADIRTSTPAELEELFEAADRLIKLVTLAPEADGGLEAVRRFADWGVTVSAGHSDATYEEVAEAIRHGVRHTTHHFNGMSPLHHREPGLAGAGLLLPELTTELICDGIHVHPAIVKLLFELKGPMRVCMITDAVECAGLPDGDYDDVTMRDGHIYLKDGSSLAGSSLTMIQALRNAIRFTGYPLEKLLPSFTQVPARQIGMDDRKGSLQPGKDADFILVDPDLNVCLTVVGGKTVYRRTASDGTRA